MGASLFLMRFIDSSRIVKSELQVMTVVLPLIKIMKSAGFDEVRGVSVHSERVSLKDSELPPLVSGNKLDGITTSKLIIR